MMPNRLDRQKRPSRAHVRQSPFRYQRGYDIRPHAPWGNTVAEQASEVASTGATAGTPGTWTPASSTPPTRTDLQQGNPVRVTASPATAWTVGQNVVCTGGLTAYWNGTAWTNGVAP